MPAVAAALCVRCNAVLRRPSGGRVFDRTLALAIAAAIVLALANAFPIVTLNLQGQQLATTLLDTVRALWSDEMGLLAVLVAFTTIVAPALEIAIVIHLLMHLRYGLIPPLAGPALRTLHTIEEWNMTEVFMLGALVALVKLNDYAQLEYGPALWCLGLSMLLLAAIGASFNAHAVWEQLEHARWIRR